MIYFLQSRSRIKIGWTRNFRSRRLALRRDLPFPGEGELIGWCDGDRRLEDRLHRLFRMSRMHGEWFYFTNNIRRYVNVHTFAPAQHEAAAIKTYMARSQIKIGWRTEDGCRVSWVPPIRLSA